MSDNEGLHVVFGTGPVGLAVMDELLSKGKRVRMVNRAPLMRVRARSPGGLLGTRCVWGLRGGRPYLVGARIRAMVGQERGGR